MTGSLLGDSKKLGLYGPTNKKEANKNFAGDAKKLGLRNRAQRRALPYIIH